MTRAFTGGTWAEVDEVSHPYLVVDIHDSDVATVSYAPAPPAGGLVFLGFQPRDYFDDPSASEDVDLDLEAEGLARWARQATGATVAAASIRPLLAEDGVEEPEDDFVEETVARLVSLLGLPVLDLD